MIDAEGVAIFQEKENTVPECLPANLEGRESRPTTVSAIADRSQILLSRRNRTMKQTSPISFLRRRCIPALLLASLLSLADAQAQIPNGTLFRRVSRVSNFEFAFQWVDARSAAVIKAQDLRRGSSYPVTSDKLLGKRIG